MSRNIFSTFLSKLFEFPLWVKQVIYLQLYKDLSSCLSEDFIGVKEADVFHINIPVLSYQGRTELADRSLKCEPNIYTFLANAADGLNILEIAMNNFWTMEEVARCYIFALENTLIKVPDSVFVQAMAGFMAGKYRTGEYFKRTGRIDVDQLEQTIRTQKEYADKGNPLKMAEVMISLGYITEKDCSSLLMIKEEAKKRFILDTSVVPKDFSFQVEAQVADVQSSGSKPEEIQAYQTEIAKLKEQNNKLKEQLAKILAFVKKNG